MPFFSIIIPVYNVAPYLRECLDSVLAQTFTDWEAICVDDGSTDGSGEILDEYAAKDSRFHVFHQPNAGVSAARNFAVRVAKGLWVGFVDGDDVIACDWFSVAAEAVRKDATAKWVHMGVSFWRNPDKMPTAKAIQDVVFRVLKDSETIIDGWKSILPHGYPWRNFFLRSLLVGRDFNSRLRIQEDMYYSLSILPLIGVSVWTDYDGYFYRYRAQSAWNGRMRLEDATNNLTELLNVWKPQSKFILKSREKNAIRRLIARISIGIIVLRFVSQFGFDNKAETKRVVRLVRRAAAQRAFSIFDISGSFKERVRFALFVITGSSVVFRPLKYFYRFEWLFTRKVDAR